MPFFQHKHSQLIDGQLIVLLSMLFYCHWFDFDSVEERDMIDVVLVF